MKRYVFAAAVLATSTAVAAPVSAGMSANGIAFNGLQLNGIAFNGLHLNGVAQNGLGMNGLGINGVSEDGFAGGEAERGRGARMPATFDPGALRLTGINVK
jgi:hypothetical protein